MKQDETDMVEQNLVEPLTPKHLYRKLKVQIRRLAKLRIDFSN